jgi:hypothetical protein
MRDSLESLAALAGEQLGEERFVAACPFAAQGFIRLEAAKTARAMRGTPSLSRPAAPVSNAIGTAPLPDNLILGMTATRLFVFELSTKIARASELEAIVPLSAITDVKVQKVKSFPFLSLLILDISIDDNGPLALEIGSPGVKEGERFVGALSSAVARREP